MPSKKGKRGKGVNTSISTPSSSLFSFTSPSSSSSLFLTKRGEEVKKPNLLVPEIPTKEVKTNNNATYTNITNISNTKLKEYTTNLYNFLENAPTSIKKLFSSLVSYINYSETNISKSSSSSSSSSSSLSPLSKIEEDISFIKKSLLGKNKVSTFPSSFSSSSSSSSSFSPPLSYSNTLKSTLPPTNNKDNIILKK